MYTLGIDIGGTHLRMGLVDRSHKLSCFEKVSVSALGENPVEGLIAYIEDYLTRNGAARNLCGICAGVPATVDKTCSRVMNAPNLKGFDGVDLREALSSRFSCPIAVDKDVNLLVLRDLANRESCNETIVAVYVGTGLGNAILIDGVLLRGAHGVAGELGHIPFGESEVLCGCGNVGCSEELVAGKYLASLCRSEFPSTHISELFLKHGEDARLIAYVERLARVIASEVNVIDPSLLILGGGVLSMAGFPKELLWEKIRAHVRKPLPHDDLEVLFAVDADTGGVIGAGIRAWLDAAERKDG